MTVLVGLPRRLRQHAFPRWLGFLLLLFTAGCQDRPSRPSEFPLRPLLYTNTDASTQAPDLDGWNMWTSGEDPTIFPIEDANEPTLDANRTELTLHDPTDLIRSAYIASAHGNPTKLQALIMSADDLQHIARMSAQSAETRYGHLQAGMTIFYEQFHSSSLTDARPDGLAGLIQPTHIQLGLPRLIDGSLTRDESQAEMYATNTLSMHILGTNIDFDVQFPRIIRDSAGEWKFAESPRVSPTWENFRRPGLALNPVLLNAEHAPFPFDVGNYWHYELKRIPRTGDVSSDDIEPTRSLGYRDTVQRVYDATLYQIVTMRRTFADPARSPETRNLLVTARHIYACNNTCYQNRANLNVLLNYMSAETPRFVFEHHESNNWGKGGRHSVQPQRSQAREEDVITVPAGSFSKAMHVFPTANPDGESIYFQKRIGILREEHIHGDVIEQSNLVQYRILR